MHCGAAWLPRGGPDCNTDARWLSAGRVPAVPLHLTCGRHSSHPRSPRFLGAGLKVIKKKLVRKAIDMIKRLADSEGKAQKKQADAEASGELGECARAMLLLLPCRRFPMSLLPAGSSSLLLPPPRFTNCPPPPLPPPPRRPADALTEEERLAKSAEFAEESGKYAKFWKNFGKSIKMGIIEDSSNRCGGGIGDVCVLKDTASVGPAACLQQALPLLAHLFDAASPPAPPPARVCVCRRRLLPLLRFASSKSPDKEITLDEYVGRMKEGQKHIYYLVGECSLQCAVCGRA